MSSCLRQLLWEEPVYKNLTKAFTSDRSYICTPTLFQLNVADVRYTLQLIGCQHYYTITHLHISKELLDLIYEFFGILTHL